MEKVIFLDRDGTINEEVEYLHRPSDLKILRGVISALHRFKALGFRLVIVTNQAGVARGYYGEEDVKALHCYLNRLLAEEGAQIDRFFYCPHHPVHGLGQYRIACHCRKPETGMFEMAEKEFPIDKAHSYLIGDTLSDMEAGERYGVRTVLIGTGYGKGIYERLEDGGEKKKSLFDFYAETMEMAVNWILEQEGKTGNTMLKSEAKRAK